MTAWPSPASVLDTAGLLELFRRVAGRELVGVVDGFGCVELVFEERPTPAETS